MGSRDPGITKSSIPNPGIEQLTILVGWWKRYKKGIYHPGFSENNP